MHREKTLHKTPHHYVAVSTCILYLNVERATQVYLCPNKYTSIVDDIKKNLMKLLKFIKVENKDEMAGSQRSRGKTRAKESGKKCRARAR